jgi:hypothetical protein
MNHFMSPTKNKPLFQMSQTKVNILEFRCTSIPSFKPLASHSDFQNRADKGAKIKDSIAVPQSTDVPQHLRPELLAGDGITAKKSISPQCASCRNKPAQVHDHL